MKKYKFKRYGRLKINKLDWLLAIMCCLFSVGALLISMAICVDDVIQSIGYPLGDFFKGLGFMFAGAPLVSIVVCVLFYCSLLLLICGAFYLNKKERKDRIPGLVAQFVGVITFSVILCLAYEYLKGNLKDAVNPTWLCVLLVLSGVVATLTFISIYMTFSKYAGVELRHEVAPAPVAAPAEEEKPVEEPVVEEEEEEPQPVLAEEVPPEENTTEVLEEEQVEEVGEETEEEVLPEENSEEGELNPYDSLGKRRKRIPFENKIKRSKPETRERYQFMVDELRRFDFNDRLSIPGETFSYKKEKLIFFTFSGETLKVYFKLDPKDYEDSPIPVKDASEVKKYEDVPTCLIVKSDLASRRVLKLAQKIIIDKNIPEK